MTRASAVMAIGLALVATPAHAATQDFAGSLSVAGDLAGDGSSDIVQVGATAADATSPNNIAAARVNLDGSFVAAAGGADGRVAHDLGGNEFVNDVVADPGGSVTFAGRMDNDVLIGRLNAGLGLDPSCDGNGANTRDLGGIDRADLIARDAAGGYLVAGVRDGIGFVMRFNGDCSFDSTFGVQVLDFGVEGEVVAVYDIQIDPATGEIVLGVELASDGGVVVLEGDGDDDTTFGGNGLVPVDLGSTLDRVTGVTLQGANLTIVGDDGSTGEIVRLDGMGNVVTGPTSFDLGPGSDVVNGVTAFGNGNLLAYGSLPGSGFSDSAAALVDPGTFTLVSTFAGDGNNTFDPAGGLNLLNDGQAVNGFAVVGALVDNQATQSFDFGLGAIGQDGQVPPSFNNGQFQLIDFTGQTSDAGGGVGGSPPGGTTPPPPTPPATGADLELTAVDAGRASQDSDGNVTYTPEPVSVDDGFYLRLRIVNKGPEAARDVVIRGVVPDGVRVDGGRPTLVRSSFAERDDVVCGDPPGQPQAEFCLIARPIPPGGSIEVFLPRRATQPVLDEVMPFSALSDTTPDPLAENNARSWSATFTAKPDTTVRFLPDGAEGTAGSANGPAPGDGGRSTEIRRLVSAAGSGRTLERLGRIARVEVAVLKKQRNRRRCLWLANKRLKFRATRARDGKCDRARWLKASGTRRWRYRLARRWPKGTYTLYARAVNRAGARETAFSKRDKNVITFTIRR